MWEGSSAGPGQCRELTRQSLVLAAPELLVLAAHPLPSCVGCRRCRLLLQGQVWGLGS